jgi:Rieske Fe-S protein
MPATDRRTFLGYCTGLLMAVIGLLVAVPALAYLVAPLRRKRGEGDTGPSLQDVGPLAGYPPGEWCLRALEVEKVDGWKKTTVRHAVWVRRQGEQDVTVLSSICPHLGCPINWHPDEGKFACPCHGGVFHTDGSRVAGPPPRAMDPLDFEIRGGRLWVRWQDFKIGVPERVPVSG